MNASRFDRWIDHRISSQIHRMLRGVRRRNRRKALADIWLVLEGDYGGQIYLSVPLQCVARNARIGQLLREMDTLAWRCNSHYGASARLVRSRSIAELERDCGEFAREDVATAFGHESWNSFVAENRMFISGGMGGGRLSEKQLWLHDEFLGRDNFPTGVQPLVNELRGATSEEIQSMDWTKRAHALLGLQHERS